MQIEDVVLIKINKSYREGMTPEELYEVTSHSWVASFEKTDTRDIQYYCAVVKNKIRIINIKPTVSKKYIETLFIYKKLNLGSLYTLIKNNWLKDLEFNEKIENNYISSIFFYCPFPF